MRILHVSDYFDLDLPGGATRLLHAHLTGLASRGHDVALLAGHPDRPASEVAPGVPRYAFPYTPTGVVGRLRSVRRIRALWREVSTGGLPDLIAFHQPLSANAILDLVRKAAVPTIYMFHSPWPREYLTANRGALGRWGAGARWALERRALRRAHRITTESRYMRREALRLYRLGEDRFVLIPGGADLDRFRPVPDREGLRRRLGVPDGLLLFALRRLVPRTGVENLIRAVAAVPALPRPVHLWIGGTGPEAGALGRLARSVGGGRVRLLGPVGEEDAPGLYAAADISAVPSRELEGFGLSTLEALASGTPVIATPVGANPEVIADLDPGLITERIGPRAIAERIVQAQSGRWCDPEFRRRCRRYVEERFSWSAAVDRFEALACDVARPGDR